MSMCHIVGNHMTWLICYDFFSDIFYVNHQNYSSFNWFIKISQFLGFLLLQILGGYICIKRRKFSTDMGHSYVHMSCMVSRFGRIVTNINLFYMIHPIIVIFSSQRKKAIFLYQCNKSKRYNYTYSGSFS